ncbi:MAG: leucyl aminopeptidase [Burkholderiales bacterium]|jgi:leucyl aminopeptidase
MEFSTKAAQPERVRTGALVIFCYADHTLSAGGKALDKLSQGTISQALKTGDLASKAGSSLILRQVPGLLAERVVLVSLGEKPKLSPRLFADSVRGAVKAVQATHAQTLSFAPFDPLAGLKTEEQLKLAVLSSRECDYKFDQLKSEKPATASTLKKIEFLFDKSPGQSIKNMLNQALALAEGIQLAKDLGNLPGNRCTPGYLAQTALQLGKQFKFKVSVLERKQIEALKMNSFLSVARGSEEPCKFIIMEYQGAAKSDTPVVLVGKGITFDTGGISLKPGAEMDEMKYDMCGAASVLGAFRAIAEMQLALNVVGLIPTTENMPSGRATKPGDIVTSMSGQTIEILNTDAEGRLILCDALTYAERYKPQAVIDIATLTGACVVALGGVHSGLFTPNDKLAAELNEAGLQALDSCWRMPVDEDYQELLKSPFADMANIGGRWAGAVTAACFLARFTKKYDWAHLDIAGTAWKSGANKGATGRPVGLLVEFLKQRASA